MKLRIARWLIAVPITALGLFVVVPPMSAISALITPQATLRSGSVNSVSVSMIMAVVVLVLFAELMRWRRRHGRAAAQLGQSHSLIAQEVARRKVAERRLQRQSDHLGQRIREINCLYALSKVFTRRDLSWREVCARTMELLPRHFHDPARVFVRLVCHGTEFRTALFRDDCMRVSRGIVVGGQLIGRVEFFYLDAGDLDYRLLFLGRERNLLDELCERLANFFERRLAEERALAAQQEAERANRAKSHFFAAASHDLRQPLQAMHLFHQILVQRLSDSRDLSVARLLGQALAQTDDLLQPLLEIAKLDAGMVSPEPATFALGELVARVAAERADEAAAKGLTLKVMPSTAVVHSDPILLGRILDNLVTNAIRHTANGRIVIGSRRRACLVSIEVWDTGPGITPDHLGAVFQEFYQIGNDERDRRRGLGLGLAIAERTARLLGHDIGLRSVPHKGSVFFVAVPTIPPGDARRLVAQLEASSSKQVA